jgi:hypothetical protein
MKIMRRQTQVFLAALACLVFSTTSALAANFTLNSVFFDEFGPSPGSVLGTGALSYNGAAALSDGSYALTSFSNLSLQLTINGFTFTHLHLTTPASEIHIEIRGSSFFFSNIRVESRGSGSQGGAADFQLGTKYLTTEPYNPITGSPFSPHFTNTPRFASNTNGTVVQGRYGAIPEPSVYALAVIGTAACAAFSRKLRRRS